MVMEDFEKIIRRHQLSVTTARIDILTTLASSREPLTIEQLGKKLTKSVHTTTLYRSLKILVDSGIVYQTDFRDRAAYYEFQGDHHHHHHMVCTQCKQRVSIELCIHDMIPSVETSTGFHVTSHLLELFGLCKNCKKVSHDK